MSAKKIGSGYAMRGAVARSRTWQEENARRILKALHDEIPVDRWSRRRIEKEYTAERVEQLLAKAAANRVNLKLFPLNADGTAGL